MKCIIHAKNAGCEWVEKYFPGKHPYLLTFANKPLIEFFIEYCHTNGLSEIKVISDIPSMDLRNYCSNGEKWGVSISYSLSKEGDDKESILKKSRSFIAGEEVCFFDGLKFINFSKDMCIEPRTSEINGIKDFYDLNMFVLKNGSRNFVLPGYTKEEGVFIGQNVEVARSCDLRKPFSIGDNVRLEQLTVIGENSVIGSNVIISSSTTIVDSIVYDGTYVGVDLDIKGKIVFKDKIINPEKGTILPIVDEFVVSSVKRGEKRGLLRFVSDFFFALILIIIMAPLFTTVMLLSIPNRSVTFKKVQFFADKGLKVQGFIVAETVQGAFIQRLFRRLSLEKFSLLLYVLTGRIGIAGNKILKEKLENRKVIDAYVKYFPGVFHFSEISATDDNFETVIMNEHYYNNHRSYLFDVKMVFKSLIRRIVA